MTTMTSRDIHCFKNFVKRSLLFSNANEYPTRIAVIRMMIYRSPYLIPIPMSYRDFPICREMPILNINNIASVTSGYFRVLRNHLQCLRCVIITARTKTIQIPSLAIESISWYCHQKIP